MSKRPIESSENYLSNKCRRETPETPTSNEASVENDSLPSTSDSNPTNFLPKDDMNFELPVELLEHIFQFLPPRERRNASLVSSKWFEIGSSRKYSLNEKLVFRGSQDFETLILFLSKTKKEFFNLEFNNCTFHDSSNLLLISEKIRSLRFRSCMLSDGFQVQLFINCYNLKEFCHLPRHAKFGFIELLAEKGFMNKNLEILRLNINGSKLNDKEINALFTMFPNMKTLPFMELGRGQPFLGFPNLFSSSLIERIISKKHTLETLKIFGYENHLRLLESHTFSRLKRLSLLLRLDIVADLSYFNFIAQLEYLEKLSLHVVDNRDSARAAICLTRFIVHVLPRCLNLKHLKLLSGNSSCALSFNPAIFQVLVSSKLISLEIDERLTLTYSGADNFQQSSENRTLRVLRIPSCIYPEQVTFFLQYFKNLKFLEFDSLSETVLESIVKFQKNLTRLKFRSLCGATPYSIAHKMDLYRDLSCLRSLTNLVSLDLDLEDDTLLFDCELVSPSVKCLRLSLSTMSKSCGGKLESGELKNSLLPLRNKRRLEAIYCKSKCADLTDLSTWLEICSSLIGLRFLCLENNTFDELVPTNTDNLFSETHKSLFECCPSLRCLMQRTLYQRLIFNYDYVDGKMKAKKLGEITEDDFITTEVIHGSKIKFNILCNDFRLIS